MITQSLSTFICSAHRDAIPFNEGWKICDIHCNFYCLQCVGNKIVSDPHTLADGTFAHTSQRGTIEPITCDVCRNVWNAAKHHGDKWSGITCLEHNFDICFDCLIRESKNSSGCISMQAHHERAHHSGNLVAWVLFVSTKEENDRRVGQGKIALTSRDMTDPRSSNFDTIANAQAMFREGFKKVTGWDPR